MIGPAALLEAADDGALLVQWSAERGVAPTILEANGRLLGLLAVPRDQLVGQSLRQLRAIGMSREDHGLLRQAIVSGRAETGRATFARAEGGVRTISWRTRPVADSDGIVLVWVVEVQPAEAELGRAAAMPVLPRHWAGLPRDSLYLQAIGNDLQMRLVWADEGFARLVGAEAETFDAAGGFAAIVTAADRDLIRLRNQRLVGGQQAMSVLRLAAAAGGTGRLRDVARPIADEEGVVRFVAGAIGLVEESGSGAGAGSLVELVAKLGSALQETVAIVDEQGRVQASEGASASSMDATVQGLESKLGPVELDRWLQLVDDAFDTGERQQAVVTIEIEDRKVELDVALTRVTGDRLLAVLEPRSFLAQALGQAQAAASSPAGYPTTATPAVRIMALAEAPSVFSATTESLFDSLVDSVLGVDATGHIRFCNRAARMIFGRYHGDIIGTSITQWLLAADGSELTIMARLRDREAPPSDPLEVLVRANGDGSFPAEISIGAVPEDVDGLMILTLRDIGTRRRHDASTSDPSTSDALTSLPNHVLFESCLTQAIDRARRERQILAVMVIDLDRFKIINASLGLEKGDQVIRSVSERLTTALGQDDLLARLGGDEFMVLDVGSTTAEGAATTAQRCLDALRPGLTISGHELSMSASVGIALFPQDGDDAPTLIKNADKALARAKEQGRGHFQFYTNDMNTTAFERLMLENRLRKALDHQELVVYYQPQVSIETGLVVGLEALLRWFHPELGLVPPGDFISLAEETGLIVPIGAWVLRHACTQVRRWQIELDRPDLAVGINLSARQFQQQDLAGTIAAVLAETELPPVALEIELTESVVMRDATESIRRLRELTTLGLKLAIDDFGTGYSSLAYLRSFPIRSLKIDRSFVQDVDRDASSETIVQTVVAMGRSLGLRVVAEGVETSQQLRQLRRLGCHEFQGFLVSRAVPAEEVARLIVHGRVVDDEFVLPAGGA